MTEAVDQFGSRFSFPGHVSVKGGGSNVVALHWRFSRQLGVTVSVVSARWPSLRVHVHQPLGIAMMARSLGCMQLN